MKGKKCISSTQRTEREKKWEKIVSTAWSTRECFFKCFFFVEQRRRRFVGAFLNTRMSKEMWDESDEDAIYKMIKNYLKKSRGICGQSSKLIPLEKVREWIFVRLSKELAKFWTWNFFFMPNWFNFLRQSVLKITQTKASTSKAFRTILDVVFNAMCVG